MGTSLAAQQDLSREQIELIKQTVAKGATDLELKLFLYQCQRTGLDPLSRQIHFIKRWNKKLGRDEGSIQTGIDGYRAVADRTGQYAGSDDAVLGGIDKFPDTATVTVWKLVGGIRCPFTATARWSEYYPGDGDGGFFWRKMPQGQLAKCAEALALRKAFPQQLAGVYTHEEMQQADVEQDAHHNAPPVRQDSKIEAPKPPIDPKPTQRPTSGATGKHAEIKVSESGDMATITGWLDNAAPRKDKKKRDFLMLTIDDVSVSCFDNKLWASVQAYKGRDVKAFVDVKKAADRTFYNLISVVPLPSVSGIPTNEKVDGPWDEDENGEKFPF